MVAAEWTALGQLKGAALLDVRDESYGRTIAIAPMVSTRVESEFMLLPPLNTA